ncbi:hypothetical protein F441_11091 [Phytophthora nicotianae CJ01A1]|uniref:Uncharacterized protein n=1 Tax=Phytophthora nicotianae CJ01A1 TaxID=1317063 RepID=W2WUN6_PHYNI|nr:hypothetical protein F441_11091 [Phytophthora nicotianae CJ01A1]
MMGAIHGLTYALDNIILEVCGTIRHTERNKTKSHEPRKEDISGLVWRGGTALNELHKTR